MHIQMEEEKRASLQKRQDEQARKQAALDVLTLKIKKIGLAIGRQQAQRQAEEERATKSFNPKESDAVNKIRMDMIRRRQDLLNKRERDEAEMAERKMAILAKLIKENDAARKQKKSVPRRLPKLLPSKPDTVTSAVISDPQHIAQYIAAIEPPLPEVTNDTTVKETVKLEKKPRLPPPQMKRHPAVSDTEKIISGESFICTEPNVAFKDFTPGLSYHKTVYLINASKSANSYRLKSFPIELEDIFSVKYDAPGPLNSGLRGKITISFHPPKDFNQDKSGDIYFRAQTGPDVCVRISCLRKRADPIISAVAGPRFEPTTFGISNIAGTAILSDVARLQDPHTLLLNFGDCIEGDSKSLSVQFKNSGAVSDDFIVKSKLDHSIFAVGLSSGTLAAHGDASVRIKFEPGLLKDKVKEHTVQRKSEFSVVFSSGAVFQINCKGLQSKSPIQVQTKRIDYQLCQLGSIYRQKVLVKNHFNISTKVWVTIDNETGSALRDVLSVESARFGTLEVTPSTAFVQVQDPFPIWFSISPSEKACQLYNNGESPFEITAKINYLQIDGRPNFVPITLTGSFTGTVIELSSSNGAELDFGGVSTLECRGLLLRITNQSRASQQIRLEPADPALSTVSGNDAIDGTINLAPFQTLFRTVQFQPEREGPFASSISARNQRNETYKISVKGHGIWPELKFSQDQVHFPAAALGTEHVVVLKLKPNKKLVDVLSEKEDNSDYAFEFGAPVLTEFVSEECSVKRIQEIGSEEASVLRVFPLKGRISKGKSLEMEVAIRVPSWSKIASQNEENSDIFIANLLKKTNKCRLNFLVPCQITPCVSDVDRMNLFLTAETVNTGNTDSSRDSNETKKSILHLNVSSDVIRPDVILTEDSSDILDFGKVCLTDTPIKKLKLQNISDKALTLSSKGLHPQGSFTVINALRDLAPGKTFEVSVAFSPKSQKSYREYLEFECGSSCIKIRLDGEGIIPTVTLESDLSKLFFGDILVGDSATQTVKMTNTSSVEATVVLDLQSQTQKGRSRNLPFKITPHRTVLAPDTSADVTITFSPQEESLGYTDVLMIHVVGRQSATEIRLNGKCWENTSFPSGFDDIVNMQEQSSGVSRAVAASLLKSQTGIAAPNAAEINGKNGPPSLSDADLAILLQSSPSRKTENFVTLTCLWRKKGALWELETRPLSIFNSKPLQNKMDGKNPCQFSITESESSFVFDSLLGDYVFCPPPLTAETHDRLKLIPDVRKGTVDLESVSQINFLVENPVQGFWRETLGQWTECVTKKGPEGSESSPTENNPQLDWIQRQIQANAYISPLPTETCFKLSLTGGTRLIEPGKGPASAFEERVFHIKLISQVAPEEALS